MTDRQSPLYWSFPFGTWFHTEVRISIFMPLIWLVLCLKFGLGLGGAIGGLLFVSILIHEFAHVFTARATAGAGNEILIWPLGGLAFVQTAPSFQSRFLTPAAGPISNLMLCLICYPAVHFTLGLSSADVFNPFVLPISGFSNNLVRDLLILTFAVNWVLALINLIPVYPLDCGRMLQACLVLKWDGPTSSLIYIRIGLVVSLLMLVGGLIGESLWLVAIGALILVLNMHESVQLQTAEAYDESFMGYDFSQGYTSLERSAGPNVEHGPGLLERWKQKREERRRLREEEEQREIEQQLDRLLAKVHEHGIESLTPAERKQLSRASNRFRNKNKPSQG